MLNVEKQLAVQIETAFEEARQALIVAAEALWKGKGEVYDTQVSIVQRLPLGVMSLVHELVKKTRRLQGEFVSGVLETGMSESIEEQLLDVANYAIALAAYRRVEARLADVTIQLKKTTTS